MRSCKSAITPLTTNTSTEPVNPWYDAEMVFVPCEFGDHVAIIPGEITPSATSVQFSVGGKVTIHCL